VAPRAYWKGYLKLSLVSCPVALFPASSEREKISFKARDVSLRQNHFALNFHLLIRAGQLSPDIRSPVLWTATCPHFALT